jgi:hypothetical protein
MPLKRTKFLTDVTGFVVNRVSELGILLSPVVTIN